ncbi:16S rRNA (guanine(527)-N(7))-methyltransferase RsmG [Tersicoccus sp. MR15.9]|uniref:16S rRNA (guanine(527)-N(7))-methyltransferase RsmG n=1 Tax=Tersicoccus mangrovi TaxID=3121635 RepID=UPI002FE6A71E
MTGSTERHPAPASSTSDPASATGTPPTPTADEARAAEQVFGSRVDLAQRYVEHLATSGIERGLLGPREVPRLWERHVLNCAVIGELIPFGVHVADVGSGAGLPGLALAIARPDLRIELIEPLERRVQWLGEVIEDLGLEQVRVHRDRAENVAGSIDVDVVTSRAVSALSTLVPWSMPLLHGSGRMLAIKGRSAADEIAKAEKAIRRAGGVDPRVLTAGQDLLPVPTTVVAIDAAPSRDRSTAARR